MTIRDIFKHLPEPYRTQALVNLENSSWGMSNKKYSGDLTRLVDIVTWAIGNGFSWSGTPEGGSYWSNLNEKYYRGELVFTLSKHPPIKTKFLEGYKLN